MTVTNASFRADFPEFASTVTYPDGTVNFWMNIAAKMTNLDRWADMADMGQELFIAHHITLQARAQKEAANGAIPGAGSGPVSSKSVDRVSVAYDTAIAAEADGGNYNLTTYGSRYLHFARLFGAGPIYVGIGSLPPSAGLAWPGPIL